jgi:hypothetical protein
LVAVVEVEKSPTDHFLEVLAVVLVETREQQVLRVPLVKVTLVLPK